MSDETKFWLVLAVAAVLVVLWLVALGRS